MRQDRTVPSLVTLVFAELAFPHLTVCPKYAMKILKLINYHKFCITIYQYVYIYIYIYICA